jgi:hypothetical protein
MENHPNPPVAPEPRRQYTRSEIIAVAQPYYPFTPPDEVFSHVMACGNHRETSPGSGIYEEISFEEFLESQAFALPPAERPNPYAAPAQERQRPRHTRAELIAVSPRLYPDESPDEVFTRVTALGAFGGYREMEPGSDLYEYVSRGEFLQYHGGAGLFESGTFALPPPESLFPLITAARPSRRSTRAELIAQTPRLYPNESPDEIFSRVMALGTFRETEQGSGLYEFVSREEFLQQYRDSGQLVNDPRSIRYTRNDLIIPVQGRDFLSPDEAFARVMSSGNYRETEMGSGLYERVSWEEFLEFARRRRLAQSNIAGAGSGEMDWNVQ